MANIQYGDMITEMRGSNNGRTYKRTMFGFAQTKRSAPRNPNSQAQQAIRSTISVLSKLWRSLSEFDRFTWISNAIAPLDGFRTFIKANFDNQRYGLPIVSNPVYIPFPDIIVYFEFNGSVVTPTLHVTVQVINGFTDLTLDWGDGNMNTYPSANSFSGTHTYTGSPAVDMAVNVTDSGLLFAVSSNQSNCVTGYQPGTSNVISLDVSGEKLSVIKVNAAIDFFDNAGTRNGTLLLNNQSPAAPPSGAAITQKASLISKGWTVLTD